MIQKNRTIFNAFCVFKVGSKNPTDKKKWIVDAEAAEVVKRIVALCVAGKGPMQIAKTWRVDKELAPKSYSAKSGGKQLPENLYHWEGSSVVRAVPFLCCRGAFTLLRKGDRFLGCAPTVGRAPVMGSAR